MAVAPEALDGPSAGGRRPGTERGADAAPAATRAAAILRLLADSPVPLGVAAIAKSLDLIPSTCLHILRALVAEDLCAFDPNSKHYTLGSGVLTLARRFLRQSDFNRLAQPVLDDIALAHGVTAIAVRVVGLKRFVVVAISRSEGAVRLQVDIGSRFPALISATGRCIAAFGGHAAGDLRKAFARLRWDNAPSFDDWLGEVEATRRLGCGIDRGNYINGITIIAAPVLNADAIMTHGLVVVGVGAQITRERSELIAGLLKAGARSLSASGGGPPEQPAARHGKNQDR